MNKKITDKYRIACCGKSFLLRNNESTFIPQKKLFSYL